ncbi:MAG: hypothetical protein K2M19_00310 [Muribaculaceae bacterium]|nr:hypothetical protein [Muribaculaceae bacterium]
MKNPSVTLQPLWINHIERFSERMRPRLYGALIAFLLHGTPIPEKLLPYLGIILDLIEAETGVHTDTAEVSENSETAVCLPAAVPEPPARELEYLHTFTEACSRRFCEEFKIDRATFDKTARAIVDYWQLATVHGAPIRHASEDEFWAHIANALHYEFAVSRQFQNAVSRA